MAIKQIIESVYPMSSNSLSAIEHLVEIQEVEAGTSFIRQDQRNEKEYFVLDGVCRSYVIDPDGEPVTISFFQEKSILSPFTTRTQDGISLLSFEALTDLKLGVMDAKEFGDMMVDNVEVREFGNFVLRLELKRKVEKELGLASSTAKERLIQFRQQFPLLENRVPHGTIASYLGITTISLSRLRGEMVR